MHHLIKVNIYLRNISEINEHTIMILCADVQTRAARLISNNRFVSLGCYILNDFPGTDDQQRV